METILHLFITNKCRHDCPLCCNKLYVIDEIPVVTVELLKKADTVCLTGGEPLSIHPHLINRFIRNLRNQYPNIKNLYIYTSGFELLTCHLWLPDCIMDGFVNGINVAPKDMNDWHIFYKTLSTCPEMFAGQSNRLYVFDDQRIKFNDTAVSAAGVLIQVLGRKWDREFSTPENEHFVRLPILF